MAIGTYSELQSAGASWLHRDDLTTEIKDFIRLAEADLQVRARLTQWDTEATVTVTTGSGPLPSDFHHAVSARWGSETTTLSHITGERLKEYDAQLSSGTPAYYTIVGDTLRVTPSSSGSVALLYTARFTALSDSATTNSLLTLFPDAYLNGLLAHANVWLADDVAAQKYGALFDASISRIKKYISERRYPDGLQMKVI